MLYDSDKIKPATESNILSKTTEYDIYSYYIGRKVPVNTKFNSPLRKDDNPSFGLFVSKKTRNLLFKDQGTGVVGNCFKFVQLLYGLSTYKEALNKINEDLSLGLLERSSIGVVVRDKYNPSRTRMAVKKKNFNDFDLKYWYKFGITRETLRKFNVFPIKKLWVNDAVHKFFYSKREPMYAFRIYNKFKIYRPLSPHSDRFLGNCNKYDVQGLQQLEDKGDTLVITKSMKDVMVLYELGFNAVAPNSESSVLPRSIMSNLRSRFDNIIVLYDNDNTGINGMIKMKKTYRVKCVFIPKRYGVKDISDFFSKYGFEESLNLLNVWLKS